MVEQSGELWGLGIDTGALRTLTEHSPDVIMVLNLECEIQFINWTAPGLSVDEVVGSQVYQYVPPEQHPACSRYAPRCSPVWTVCRRNAPRRAVRTRPRPGY